MDIKEVKTKFNTSSNNVIKFMNELRKVTYCSTLLVIDNEITAHQSNGYNNWDKRFYYDGLHKDSLLVKLGIELTNIRKNETSTVIWDDVLKSGGPNKIDELRKKNNIYHGISFIYGIEDYMSLSINSCTGKNTERHEFENFILPMRFELLNFFKDL